MSHASVHRPPARFDATLLPGAKSAPFPGFIEPCHPTLRQNTPSGEGWLHEIKFDAYRTQAHLRKGRPAIYTRAGYDWTLRFQPIADALATVPATDLILDGESVADSRGIPVSGCFTPISQPGAMTGCSTTPSTCSVSTASMCAGPAC